MVHIEGAGTTSFLHAAPSTITWSSPKGKPPLNDKLVIGPGRTAATGTYAGDVDFRTCEVYDCG